jgi:hypothetical protein
MAGTAASSSSAVGGDLHARGSQVGRVGFAADQARVVEDALATSSTSIGLPRLHLIACWQASIIRTPDDSRKPAGRGVRGRCGGAARAAQARVRHRFQAHDPIEVSGIGLLAVMTVAAMFGVSYLGSGQTPLDSPAFLGCVAVALIALVAFVRHSRRHGNW